MKYGRFSEETRHGERVVDLVVVVVLLLLQTNIRSRLNVTRVTVKQHREHVTLDLCVDPDSDETNLPLVHLPRSRSPVRRNYQSPRT